MLHIEPTCETSFSKSGIVMDVFNSTRKGFGRIKRTKIEVKEKLSQTQNLILEADKLIS